MNARQPTMPELTDATWPAQLRLQFAHRQAQGTRLIECRHSGPLRVQRPFYPEGPDCAHVYLLHPPGGVVSGDELGIRVDVGEHAGALITTPGAGRIYRARTAHGPSRQAQRVQLQVSAHALLEWLPQPTIVFDGADVRLDNHVDIAADGAFMGWEILCLGRPASRLPFVRGQVEQRWRIERDGRALLNDRLGIDGADALRDAAWGLQKFPVYGTFLAVPAAHQQIPDAAIAALREALAALEGEREVAVTRLRGIAIVRYLGSGTERAQLLFECAWHHLRPWLSGRPASRPRIWNT